MKYVIGIDLGTSAVKTVLFNEEGKIVASSSSEYPIYFPKNGWAEQDPRLWWESSVKTIQQVLVESKITNTDVVGVGLSGQMHGLVMLDKKGEPLRNSILWCDGRTTTQCEKIHTIIGKERLIEITANPALAGFTAGKILWVKENEPEIFAQCEKIMLPKDYIRYKLCGTFFTDASDASGTNLLDIAKRTWSDEILEKLEIDSNLLPKVLESCEVAGEILPEIASLTGLAVGTSVVAGAGDNAVAAIGTGIVETGKAFTTIGTSGVIFAHSEKAVIDPKGRVHTFCSAVPGKWSVMSCTLSAGGSLQWFRNNFCSNEVQIAIGMKKDPYYIMDLQAEKIQIGANQLLFLPYLMGERSPILDEKARGVFLGLSGMHTKQHLLRAVMEGVVYSQRECLEVFREMQIPIQDMIATGGGAVSSLWRQMLADNYSLPITTIKNQEGPALGAAILAGVGAGLYESIQVACEKILEQKSVEQPSETNSQSYTEYYKLYKQMYPILKEQFHYLSTLK